MIVRRKYRKECRHARPKLKLTEGEEGMEEEEEFGSKKKRGRQRRVERWRARDKRDP